MPRSGSSPPLRRARQARGAQEAPGVAIADQLARRIEERLGKPLDAVLDAWANATKKEAPQNTGALALSVHAERTAGSPTEGALVMRWYGKVVASGTPALSAAPRNVRARQRYAQK